MTFFIIHQGRFTVEKEAMHCCFGGPSGRFM